MRIASIQTRRKTVEVQALISFSWCRKKKRSVCVPSNLTAEGLKKTYGFALEEVGWAGLPNDASAVCMKTDLFDLRHVLCRKFVQHMMGA